MTSEIPSVTPSASLPSDSSANFSFSNVHHYLSVKLSSSNYLVWRSQFMPLLRSTGFLGFIDGSKPCPLPFLAADLTSNPNPATPTPNPAYFAWKNQDQLLLSWLLSSLTESVHSEVVGLGTSSAVWNALASTYASTSQTRVMQLRLQLHSITKGSDTMQDYLLKVKQLTDALNLASFPVSDSELVLFVLGGLGSEYESFVTAVTTRETPIQFPDLRGLLLCEEIRHQNSLQDISNITEQFASTTVSATSGNSGPSRFGRNLSGSGDNFGHRGSGSFGNRGGRFVPSSGRFGNRGRGRSGVVCQFCDRPGHHAKNCFQLQRYRSLPVMPHPPSGSRPQAYVASMAPSVFCGSNPNPVSQWIPDTGASHHLTPDYGSLRNPSEYQGSDSVTIGDGTASLLGPGPASGYSG